MCWGRSKVLYCSFHCSKMVWGYIGKRGQYLVKANQLSDNITAHNYSSSKIILPPSIYYHSTNGVLRQKQGLIFQLPLFQDGLVVYRKKQLSDHINTHNYSSTKVFLPSSIPQQTVCWDRSKVLYCSFHCCKMVWGYIGKSKEGTALLEQCHSWKTRH